MTDSIEFETTRLRLRRWRPSDRAPFAAMNADPLVMRFFPAALSRQASDASIDRWEAQFSAQGWGNWAVELLATGEFIGYVGLSVPLRVLPFPAGVEIGWRLARSYWGNGYATEGAVGVLKVGFERVGLADIVSFTADLNRRSWAVMERLGMRRGTDFDHPAFAEGHPLRRHRLYRLTREQWTDQ